MEIRKWRAPRRMDRHRPVGRIHLVRPDQHLGPFGGSQPDALGDRLRAKLNELASKHAVPMVATGFGSIFGIHFHDGKIRNIDDLDQGEAGREAEVADLKELIRTAR